MTTPPPPPSAPPTPPNPPYGAPSALPTGGPLSQPGALAQPYAAVAPQYQGGPGGTRYGGFWIRVAAYVIDSVLLSAVVFGLLAATKPIQCLTADGSTCIAGTTTVSPLFYVLVALPLLYLVVLWAIGGTLGQRLVGLRVVNAQTGGRLGIGRSLLRLVGYLISQAVLYIGLIWVAFDGRKQGWHDKIAGSLVMRR